MRFPKGFTLIELLVVISIISILISILLPALGSARKSAHNAQCQANLRQLGVVVFAYSNDFKDRVPFSDAMTWAQQPNDWFSVARYLSLGHYLVNPSDDDAANTVMPLHSIWKCPAVTNPLTSFGNSKYPYYYIKNDYINSNEGGQEWARNNLGWWASELALVRLGLAPHPSETFYMKDAQDPSRVKYVANGIVGAGPHLGENVNVLFLDGHVISTDTHWAGLWYAGAGEP
jgi:prepilin-type N-terminal cleavage/methylation domain-containing protein/prepilin-type processing-associated H-X9-DG protein